MNRMFSISLIMAGLAGDLILLTEELPAFANLLLSEVGSICICIGFFQLIAGMAKKNERNHSSDFIEGGR